MPLPPAVLCVYNIQLAVVYFEYYKLLKCVRKVKVIETYQIVLIFEPSV